MTGIIEQKGSAKVPVVAGASVAALVPQSVEEVFRLAQAVHASGLAPRDMSSPEKLTIAIMTGLEVGLPPMQAIQSIAVINGRPTIWGDGLLAVVRRSPLCSWIREWTEGEGEALTAFCETQRAGEPTPIRRSFSSADAKVAGLFGKTGPWSQYRKRMLQMRARALCLRDVYADLLKGIQMREEVEDYAPREARDITPAEQSPAMARLAASRAAQEAPALTPITEYVENEIDAMGLEEDPEDGDDGAEQDTHGGDFDGCSDGTAPDMVPDIDPALTDALQAFSEALFRADNKRALSACARAFWDGRDDCPDPGSPETKCVDRVYVQHVARVDGALDAGRCRMAVAQVISEVR